MNEFYTNALRKACYYQNIDFFSLSDTNAIIYEALDSLSEYEREYITRIYSPHCDELAPIQKKNNMVNARRQFGISKERAQKLKKSIQSKLVYTMEHILKRNQ